MSEDEARRGEISRASRRIEGFLGALSADDLSRQSACEGWSVGDVVGHLIERGRPIPDQIERGLSGDLSPTPGFTDDPPLSEDQFRVDLDRRAVTLRQELGEGLLAEFARVNREFERVMSLVGDEDWDKRCYHRLSPETVRSKVDIRIAELAMHEWDMRWALDRNAALAEESLPGLVNASGRAVRRAFRADPSRQSAVRYRFALSEPSVDAVDVTLRSDGVGYERGGTDTPDVLFRCSSATYSMLIFGRWKLDAVIGEGLVSVEGDETLVDGFIEAFVGG